MILTLRAKDAAALWVVVRMVVRMVVRAAGVCGKGDERTTGTTVAPSCSGFDVPSGGDRGDVSSGSRRCLARRWLNLIKGHRNIPMTAAAVVPGGSVSGGGGDDDGGGGGRVPAAFKTNATETCAGSGAGDKRRRLGDGSGGGGST